MSASTSATTSASTLDAAATTRFYATLSALLAVPAAELGPHSSRQNLPQWDSLKHMHLMLALEEAFGVEFDDAELSELDNVQALLDGLARKI